MEILILNNPLRLNYLLAYVDQIDETQKKILVPRISVLGEDVPPELEILPVEESVAINPDDFQDNRGFEGDGENGIMRALKVFASKNRRRTKILYRIWWRSRHARRAIEVSLNQGRRGRRHLVTMLSRRFMKEAKQSPRTRTMLSVLSEQFETGQVKNVVLFDVDILPQISELCRNYKIDLRVI